MNSSAASPFPESRPGGPGLRRARRGKGAAGFTLVETLVAVTILALITTLLAQVMGAASLTSQVVQRRINNFTKARALIDLFSQDLAAGLYRSDLAFYPAGGQTLIAFYTQRPGVGATATRNLALVQYAIDTTSAESPLQRSDLAIGWDKSQSGDVSFGEATTLPKLSLVKPSDTANGVVGLQVRFLLADGTIQAKYANTVDNPLRAIGVTMAVVDDESLRKMTPARLNALRAVFASTAPADHAVKEAWQDALGASFDWPSYPATLSSGLLIFERFVYVSPVF
ncbi:Verru_Chthon cassette protein C [Verrucomicrobium sp. GAS474]|uniref:PulJ/GspJ family protein n=1 Tax=Verrucomicrobium sp. GAS474 TaxID=1882831 RepID=UPI000879D1A2|nr:prepilin-type N-terminal cleavage/methylation domain-containing protein [Verrucomicrobium sp. GAS474]SDT88763.1 Verru_Chthon cassette protein C [Verrucomicrobium sp. GAS474]